MAKISACIRRIEGRIKPENNIEYLGRIKPENNIEYLAIKAYLDEELKLCPEHSYEYTEVDGYIIIEDEDPDPQDMFEEMLVHLAAICEAVDVKYVEEEV